MTLLNDVNKPSVFIDGLIFPECARWHDGALWFSDFFMRQVFKADLEGWLSEVVAVENMPSGLGWLPDGSLLIMSMADRKLLRHDAGGLTTIADMSGLIPYFINDMVVDRSGRAYVGNVGYSVIGRSPRKDEIKPTKILTIAPDGSFAVAAENLICPNGMVISKDGKTLIVAETWAERLTAFSIGEDGALSDRRCFATLPGEPPDGICQDSAGAVWVASPLTRSVLRVEEGGNVTDVVKVDEHPVCCVLGGSDGRTLFILSTHIPFGGEDAERRGRVDLMAVHVPA